MKNTIKKNSTIKEQTNERPDWILVT